MRLKTYTAATMADAMHQVRRELGEDAIIVATRSGPGGRGVCLQAAIEEPDDEAYEGPSGDCGPDPQDEIEHALWRSIRDALTFHGLPGWLRDRLLRVACEQANEDADTVLANAIDEAIAFEPLDERTCSQPVMFIGVPGAGKTIATAKSILRARRAGRAVTAITTDGRRAGAFEQLEAFTRILDVPLQRAETPKALAAAVNAAGDRFVVIDTAGVNPLNDSELNELAALIRASRAEPIVVVPAGVDVTDSAETAQSFGALGARRLMATKMDLSRRYGAPIVAAATARLAIAGAGISADIADGFKPITPVSAARLLLPMESPPPPPLQPTHSKLKEPAL